MKNAWLNPILFVTTLLSGFYGGIGFFTVMGGNPAVAKLSDAAFAEYWQSIDGYMAARMPVFGLSLLFSVALTAVLLFRNRFPLAGRLILFALLVILCEAVFVGSINRPNNVLIQSWDLAALPANVSEVKQTVVNSFYVRLWFMVGQFALVLAAVWVTHLRERANLLRAAESRLTS